MVKILTKEIIKQTVQNFAQEDNGFWLKLAHFASLLNLEIFDPLESDSFFNKRYGENIIDRSED
jgi:hypothetical protein